MSNFDELDLQRVSKQGNIYELKYNDQNGKQVLLLVRRSRSGNFRLEDSQTISTIPKGQSPWWQIHYFYSPFEKENGWEVNKKDLDNQLKDCWKQNAQGQCTECKTTKIESWENNFSESKVLVDGSCTLELFLSDKEYQNGVKVPVEDLSSNKELDAITQLIQRIPEQEGNGYQVEGRLEGNLNDFYIEQATKISRNRRQIY